MPDGDSPAVGRPSFSRKLGAFAIDLAILGAIVYAGRVIATGVVVYLDNLVRPLVTGSAGSGSLAELQGQIRVHPLLLGRPLLLDVLCNDLFPAAALFLYLGFLSAEFEGGTPGAVFLRGSAAWPRIRNTLSNLSGYLAKQISQTIDSWLPGSGGFASLRKRASNLGELFAPARMLPADSRGVGLGALGIAVIATAATPLVYSFNNSLARVSFENAYGKPAFVAQATVWLSLIAIAVGWAAALTGAAMTNALTVAVIAPVYVFSLVFLGLVGGRAWWLAIPQWTLPGLAAIAPSAARRWPVRLAVLWALCALAVLHSFRLTPLHAFRVWSSWRIVLPLGLVAALAIGRLRRRPSAAVVFIGLLIVNGAFIAAALRAGLVQITAGVYESLYQLAGILTLFWFFLGTNLVGACVGLTGSVVSTANRFCAERRVRWIVVGLCLAELFLIGELMRFNPAFMGEARTAGQNTIRLFALPAHQGIAIAILLIAALCAAAGRLTPGCARGLLALWGFSLFLIWSWFLSGIPLLSAGGPSAPPSNLTLHHGFALLQGIEKRLGGERQFLAIGLVTFTLLWEVFAGTGREAAGGGPRPQAQGALILYLGVLALLAALTHFAFASATMSPQAADAYMYSGMQALWLPVALYAAFFAQRQVRAGERRMLIGAFLAGLLAATPVCFQRVLIGDPARAGLWMNISVVAASEAIMLAGAMISVRAAALRAIDAVATAGAFAMDFAVAYTQGLMAPLLNQFAGIIAALTGFSSVVRVVRLWLEPARWNVVPQGDLLIFYLVLPVSAGAAATLLWNARRRGRQGLAMVMAAVIGAATVAYTIPLYGKDALRSAFSPAAANALTPALYSGCIAWLAPLTLVFGAYIYAAAWRPAAEPEQQTDEELAPQPNPRA